MIDMMVYCRTRVRAVLAFAAVGLVAVLCVLAAVHRDGSELGRVSVKRICS
jgi:hypothetical protein